MSLVSRLSAASATPDGAENEEIEAERAYLLQARAALRAMRADVVGTDTPELVSPESDEIWFNTMYKMARLGRAEALRDLPDVPLFFGRLEYESSVLPPELTSGAAAGHPDPSEAEGPDCDHRQVYIGRRHVHDAHGLPLVIDWRAPVSTPFYRASGRDRQGVIRRRRYGFSDSAQLTAYEDEHLAGVDADPNVGEPSAVLTAEIERPRTGPMRDIVATIQPEQDYLVRAPFQPTICVQGAPGTGKTAVGLHRLAYLLYTEPERLAAGVAVIGPNKSFLTYIRRVLPALGEGNVTQTTVEELMGRPATGQDSAPTAIVKGDARMAPVLDRAMWAHLGRPDEEIMVARGASRYRLSPETVHQTALELRQRVRYGSGRRALAQRLAHLILVQMERRGASPDDRDQGAIASCRAVRRAVDQVWPKLTPERVLFRLLSDRRFLEETARDDLTAAERELLTWERPPRSARSAKWSPADVVLLDELTNLMDRASTLSHLVIDEAQDLSPMQCRALGRRCVAGSLTVLGDLAQGTSPWAVDDWASMLRHLGKPDAQLAILTQGFRAPAEIIDYAARLLPSIAPGLGAPTSIRRLPGALTITQTTAEGLIPAVVEACERGLAAHGSLGVIVADPDLDQLRDRLAATGLNPGTVGREEDAMEASPMVCVPSSLAKGLEFDRVVVVEPARIVQAEPRGLHRLYVVLTRAVSRLRIVHSQPLPPELTDPPEE